MVYDIASRESYNALTNWLTDARTLASPNIIIVMVGNKKDLEAEREVTFMEASRFAQENGKLRSIQCMCSNFSWIICNQNFECPSVAKGVAI